MVFAGTGQIDLIDTHHLFHIHLVVNDRNFWELTVVEAGKNLVHVHFSDAMRRFFQTVVPEVETQGFHHSRKRVANTIVALIPRKVVGHHGCLKAAIEQCTAHSHRLVGNRARK